MPYTVIETIYQAWQAYCNAMYDNVIFLYRIDTKPIYPSSTWLED